MSEILETLVSASLWIGVILGAGVSAIAGLLLQLFWNSRAHKVASLRARMKLAAESRRGRTPALGGPIPRAGDVLPDFFRQQEGHVDLAIYELSLRPDIPVMDLLYLEYLRARLEDGSIDRVVIVPWSGWRDESNSDGEYRVSDHLRQVFGRHLASVTIVTAAMLQEHADSVFQNEFFEQVGNLGNSNFLRTASLLMGYRFRSYHDINQGHPESHQARSIVEHTVRGWLIYKYIEQKFINSPTPPRRIGSLLWERELTKLLLLSNIVANHEAVDCSLVLGGSVTYRHRLKQVPLPTFASDAISVFGDPDALRVIISKKTPAELRKTNEVLCKILESRRGLRDLPGWGESHEKISENGLHGDALAVTRSLRRVRSMYGA